ncbi:formimidoylglutamate deiminase [Caulobacter sp. SLTY]|uniref:formimidoylglutamate deiminase n=1 Tax=Caulobacter sp. SLTY TaxID=2683262 RepID=UPI001412B5A9|nr:formimidoylglutamate deiminase [Caulobacter sp. SLTY]NBB17492.1 formimidoylglutamate deiminase [Caulobacter sp. SLTY]
MRTSLFLDRALLPHGWASDVRITHENGLITTVETGAAPATGETREAFGIPGMPNLHSHAFQRAMAGLAERRGPAADSFWTWREVMYRFLERLGPDQVEAIAAYAFADMLEAGFTAVAEFHYLHHSPDGSPYADVAELARRHLKAAADTGIGITLLPVFYAHATFGGEPPTPGQRRFINDPARFARIVEALQSDGATVGVAPHSLRAATPDELKAILPLTDGPVHIHAAEQVKEVEDCLAWSGQRPVEWLLDHAGVDQRWCLIHATHLTPAETRDLAASGAVAGLCPITEANLGDGIFPAAAYLEAGGRFGVGTDSNIAIDAAGELRQLEYAQRLSLRGRNLLSQTEGQSTGRALLDGALKGGARALGQRLGALAVGHRADVVCLDMAHPDMTGRGDDLAVDTWVFALGRAAIASVYSGGRRVVENGRHLGRSDIDRRYGAALRELIA